MLETEKIKIRESLQIKYGDEYSQFKWITGEEAQKAEEIRAEVLASLKDNLLSAYSNTKPYYMDISPGCRTVALHRRHGCPPAHRTLAGFVPAARRRPTRH